MQLLVVDGTPLVWMLQREDAVLTPWVPTATVTNSLFAGAVIRPADALWR